MSVSEVLAQQQRLTARLAKLSQSLAVKEDVIENLKTQLASQTKDFQELRQQNAQLSHIVRGLSQHITEELGAVLPIIPLPSPLKTRASSHGPSPRQKKSSGALAVKTKPLIKETYSDFSGAGLLEETIEAQLRRTELTRTLGTLFNKSNRPVIKNEIHSVAFESLSLMLTLTNLSHCNHADIYLPRLLQMLTDLLEVERVSLYVECNSADLQLLATTIDPVSEVLFSKSQDHFDTVIGNRQAVLVNDTVKLRTDSVLGVKTRSLLCVPIVRYSKAIGCLEVANKITEFTQQDTSLLTEVAKRLADYLAGVKCAEARQSLQDNYESAESALLSNHMAAFAGYLQIMHNLNYIEIYRADSERLVAFAGDETIDFTEFLAKTLTGPTPKVHPIMTKHGTKQLLSLRTSTVAIQVLFTQACTSSWDDAMIQSMTEAGKLADEILKGVKLVEGLLMTSDLNELGMWGLCEAVLVVSPIGIIQKVNPAAEKVFAEPAGQLVGKTLGSLLRDNQELLQSLQSSSGVEGITEIPIKSLIVKGRPVNCTIRSVRGAQAHCLVVLPNA